MITNIRCDEYTNLTKSKIISDAKQTTKHFIPFFFIISKTIAIKINWIVIGVGCKVPFELEYLV